MRNLMVLLSFLLLIFPVRSQKSKNHLPNKPGIWKYDYKIQAKTADEIQFKKNVTNLVEWFHQQIPLFASPKGYNLWALATGMWDNHYRFSPINYGLRAEINFYFHMFFSDGSIWKVELPESCYYSFNINNTQGGILNHHGQFPYFDHLKDNPKLEKAINTAASKLDDIKTIFPFKESLADGVDLFEESPGSNRRHIVIFNPERPPYNIPVTVKEVATAYLEYYSLYQKTELDLMLLQELKKEIANIPAEELNAQAYTGHNSNIVFRFNGQKLGMPLVRFNPEYWDRSLPPSAIQYLSFYVPQVTEVEIQDYLERFGYPNYSKKLLKEINWGKLSDQIMKKR